MELQMKDFDEMSVNERKQVSDHAKQLLNDELLTTAFKMVENELVDEILSTSPEEQQKREQCYLLVQALNKLRGWLVSAVEMADVDRHNALH